MILVGLTRMNRTRTEVREGPGFCDMRSTGGLLEEDRDQPHGEYTNTTHRLSTLDPTQKFIHSEPTLSSSQTSSGLLYSNNLGAMRDGQFFPLPLMFKFGFQRSEVSLTIGFSLLPLTYGCIFRRARVPRRGSVLSSQKEKLRATLVANTRRTVADDGEDSGWIWWGEKRTLRTSLPTNVQNMYHNGNG